MRRLARWSIGHPVLVLVLWVVAIAAAQLSSATVGPDYRNSFSLPGTDSQRTLDLLQKDLPQAAGDFDSIVFRADQGSVSDPQVRARVEPMLAEVAKVPSVTGVISPYSPAGAAQLSPDGQIGYAQVRYAGSAVDLPRADIERIVDLAEGADGDGLTVAVGGQGVLTLSAPTIGPAELIGVAVAALILFLAFGSLVAMTLPIISAVAALGVGTAVVGLLTHTVTIADVAPTLGVLLGLGVGIDYALFIVNRHRTGLRAGMSVADSVAIASDTSGRAVVFAGITVCIALLGLFVTGVEFLYGLAIGASIAVACTVLASITLLPALLTLLGTRVLSRKHRAILARGETTEEHAGRFFQRWATAVRRHPVVLAGAGLVALLVIAVPTLDLRLGVADQGNDPKGTTSRTAYDLITEGFGPGANGPLVVAVDLSAAPLPPTGGTTPAGPPPTADTLPPQLRGLVAALKADPDVASVLGPIPSPNGTTAVLQVIPRTSPQTEGTSQLIERIRTDMASQAASTGAVVHVGGATATFDDFADKITMALPLFFTVVIGLSFLLLMLAFRSLLVPAVGAVLNLVSAAAAFGVVTAVFQWGWGSGLIGLGKAGPIEPFIPVILFALLFGLSMDYQVFLVSRMHEMWLRTRDNTTAVRTGHADTGRVIIAAASIMVFVFGAFVFGDSRIIKLLGLGMAAAVLLDAFVIRMIVVPALMHLTGRATWWLPGWLDRILPHVTVEASHQPEDNPSTPPQLALQTSTPAAATNPHPTHPGGRTDNE
ncbi:MMPL family transporter [Micromonospora maritima]|uniref:MMPL family transporter n=1 Tax=Micromonospora maritima TaxID=986711 RepID=UPI0037B880C7